MSTHHIRIKGAYVIRSAESRPGPVRAIIAAVESRSEQRERAFPRVVTTDDLALVRAIKAHRNAR